MTHARAGIIPSNANDPGSEPTISGCNLSVKINADIATSAVASSMGAGKAAWQEGARKQGMAVIARSYHQGGDFHVPVETAGNGKERLP